MAFDISAEEEAVNSFHHILKKLGAVSGKIENHSQSKQNERKFYAPKRKRHGDQRENDWHERADGAAANFSLAYFRIFYMFGVKYIPAHPIQCKPY